MNFQWNSSLNEEEQFTLNQLEQHFHRLDPLPLLLIHLRDLEERVRQLEDRYIHRRS